MSDKIKHKGILKRLKEMKPKDFKKTNNKNYNKDKQFKIDIFT